MSNLIYRAQEAIIEFSDTDGDYALSLANLAAGSGRISDRVDRGANSQPMVYKWRASFQCATAPVSTGYVDVLLSESDGTYTDGNISSADSAVTFGQYINLQTIGDVRVQSAVANTSFVASGSCWITARYFQIGLFNRTTSDFRNLNNISRVLVIPMPPEIQDSI